MNSNLKGVQKVLASLTMTATVFSLAGFAALTPATALAVAPADYGLHEGDTISAAGSNDPDVYIVNDWGYKRLFVNPAIFNLYGHLSWAGVKAVSPATRDAFGTSGLFRVDGDQKVYGLDVVSEDVANLRWVNTSGAQAVADDPNFFKKVFVINAAEKALYGTGADYTSVLQVPAYTRGGLPVTGGALSASLSSDNPASNTFIAGQAAGDLAHFTFTGNGTVTAVTLQRIGVSADTTLSNVYLYNGSKRLTDAATVSQGKITFNDTAGVFTVAGSANISVKADIAGSTSGQTIGVQLISYSVGGTPNTVSLSGNLFTIATAPSDFATLAVGTSTPGGAGITLDPQVDYIAWQNVVTVGNHDVWLQSLQLRVIGSVLPGDLQNFRLYADGVQVGSAIGQVDSNGYVVFAPTSPYLLKTGSRTLKLVIDVIGGSNRNFTISLRQKPDIFVTDTQYGQAVLSTGTFPASAPNSSSDVQTVNQGSVTITKRSDSPSGDVVKDSAGAVLARYDVKAFGEKMKFENLRVAFTGSATLVGDSLRNGSLYVDGSQVGSTQTLFEDTASGSYNANGYTEYSLGSSFIVNPGQTRVLEIRADVYDNSTGPVTNEVAAGVTIQAKIDTGSSNVQRLTSLNYIGCIGGTGCTTTAAANTLTVKTGAFTVAKYTGYADQSIVAPKTAYKIGHYTMTAASSEDINVNTVNVDSVGAGGFTAADISDMYLKVWSDTGAMVYQSSPKSTMSPTASNSYSVNFTIPKTKTYQVEVYATVNTPISTGTFTTNLDAAGLTTSSNTTSTAIQASGQTLTGANGALTLANGSSPASRLIDGGKTVTAYVFTLQPQYDDFTLDEATFKLSSTVASSTGAVGMLYLKDGSTVIASSPITTLGSAAFDITGINYPMLSSGGTHTLTVDVALSNVGVGGNDTGGLVKVQLSHLKYHDSNGNITTSAVAPATFTGNSETVTKAYPSFTNVALPSTVLAPGDQTLFKTNVTANGGSVAWRKVVFTVAVTANPKITVFKLFENGVEISSLASATFSGNGAGAQFATNSKAFSSAAAGTGTVVWVFNTDRLINGGSSSTLELKGTVGGANVAGDSITTSIANTNGSTFVASDDVLSLGGTAASAWRTDVDPTFLWSDSSAPSHASTTDDWMGDALITGIAAAQSLYQ